MSEEEKEYKVIYSDLVKKQMEEDPELAKAIREFTAAMRQALHAVETGQHKTLDDAVEAITGNRPVPVDDPFEDDDE